MPRLRKGPQQQPRAASGGLTLRVQHQGTTVSILCGDGSQDLAWLATQAEMQLRLVAAHPQDGGISISHFSTPSGQVLAADSVLKDTVSNKDLLIAHASPGAHLRTQEDDRDRGGPNAAAVAAGGFSSTKYTEAYGHNARVFDLAFAPTTSSMFATASDDGTAKVWWSSEGGAQCRQAASFHGHTDSVMCVSWSPDARLIATGSADTTVQLWRPGAAAQDLGASDDLHANYGVDSVANLSGHPEEVYACEFLEGGSGRCMLTASAWSPYLWDLETCQQLAEGGPLPAPLDDSGAMPDRWQEAHIFCARQAPGGSPLIAASCSDGALRFWTLQGGYTGLQPHAVARPHPGGRGMGSQCAWAAGGNRVASLATNGTLAVLDVRMNGRVCWYIDAGRPLTSCCFLPSHPEVVAVCGRGPGLTLFDTSTTSPAPGHRQSLLDCSTTPLHIDPKPLRPPKHMDAVSARVASASRTMGQRSLLCVAASHDGTSVAASGEAAIMEQSVGGRWGSQPSSGTVTDKPTHKQSKRASVEVWHSLR